MPTPDHVTSWTSNGGRWSVSSTCHEGQTAEQCLAEHNQAVAVLQVLHPPDP